MRTSIGAGIDSHNNAEVRALLTPLARLASKYKIAIVGVTHLNKGNGPAMYRATGSLAFVAAARAVFVVIKDPEDPARRLVLPVKNNLAVDNSGLAYRIVTTPAKTPTIGWEPGPVTVTADELMSAMPNERGGGSDQNEAVDWIRAQLKNGPQKAKDLVRRAEEDGLEWRTVHRAKNRLRIKPRKQTFSGGWVWELPKHAPTAHEDDNEDDSEFRQDPVANPQQPRVGVTCSPEDDSHTF